MIYLDMDGVLMDFDRGLRDCGIIPWSELRTGNRPYHYLPKEQWTPEETVFDRHIQVLMATDHFWPGLKPMADAHVLWRFCEGAHVLTARPHNEEAAERVSFAKRCSITKWFDGTFPADRMHICLRSEKKNFAAGNVLVDDLPGNCEEWNAAGGTAILHKDALTTIRKLEEIYHA